MKSEERNKHLIRFAVYAAIIVLLNIAARTFFFHIDLTQNRTYALSAITRQTFSSLEEPLTIRAYFSDNLPAGANNLPQNFRDLMGEAAIASNRNFNYDIQTIPADGKGKKAERIREEAESYGIYPREMTGYKDAEIKLVSAYRGVVIISGDTQETLPALEGSENLEYLITTTIRKISRKNSAFLALETPVEVLLYYTPVIGQLYPDLAGYPDDYEKTVNDIAKELFGKVSFAVVDPASPPVGYPTPEEEGMFSYTIETNDGEIPVMAMLLLRNGDEKLILNLLEPAYGGMTIGALLSGRTDNLTVIGINRMYPAEAARDAIIDGAATLVGINEKVAWMNDRNTLPLAGNNTVPLQAFRSLAEQNYVFEEFSLSGDGPPPGVNTMLVVNPGEELSPWDIYRLDQFIMGGGSLGVFIDPYEEVTTQYQNPMGGGPMYLPNPNLFGEDVSLKGLLAHYGIDVEATYLFDENAFVDRSTGQERIIYFMPELKEDSVNTSLKYMKNLTYLFYDRAAPLAFPEGSAATPLLSSSENAWTETMDGGKNPMFTSPPASGKKSYPLAAIVEGSMKSYFDGKEIPSPPEEAPVEGEEVSPERTLQPQAPFIPETDSGRLFVTGTSRILSDMFMQQSPNNQAFILDVLDVLNDNSDLAVLRNKQQAINPIKDTTAGVRNFVMLINTVGMVLFTAIAGLIAYLNWSARKKSIERIFGKDGEGANA